MGRDAWPHTTMNDQQILQHAIRAIRNGDKTTGRRLLAQVLRADRRNVLAWLWMSAAVEDDDRRRDCLRQALAIDPDNQRALVQLILALTEQFGSEGGVDVSEPKELLPRLGTEYERLYYAGLISERRAKGLLKHGTLGSGPMVYHLLRDAMAWYEKAEHLRPPGNDDVFLRWNTCARVILRNRLRPPPGPPGT